MSTDEEEVNVNYPVVRGLLLVMDKPGAQLPPEAPHQGASQSSKYCAYNDSHPPAHATLPSNAQSNTSGKLDSHRDHFSRVQMRHPDDTWGRPGFVR
eukprot:scaffold508829_cov19-Prasinocladus_malaysianus.AAC.1